jgi:broad specificity phosphatase PhoE
VLLVRHAESTWNAQGRWQGHGDPPLSERGRHQAEALAQALAPLAIEVLATSDLARAAETAAPLARALALEPLRVRALRELDVGLWCGLTRAEIAGRDAAALARFDAGGEDARAGGGESRAELARRAGRAVAALLGDHPGRRIAVVTHLGVIRALAGTELGHAEWRALEADALPEPPR